jgi:hypothetical protein
MYPWGRGQVKAILDREEAISRQLSVLADGIRMNIKSNRLYSKGERVFVHVPSKEAKRGMRTDDLPSHAVVSNPAGLFLA